MRDLLLKSGIEFDESGFMKIPDWVKRIKIDIGLSDGAPQSANWFEQERHDDDLLIFGFEPIPSNAQSIRTRNSEWSTTIHPKYINKKFFLIECALSDVAEMQLQNFYRTIPDSGCSSLLPPKEFEVAEVLTVQTWSLNHFFKFFPFHRIPYIEFIKTDCQGSDIDVVRGCSQFLNKVAIFTCEADDTRYHNSKNTLKALTEEFRRHGFFLYRNYMKFTSKVFGPRLKRVDTEDPTFINQALRKEIANNKIRAYQQG